MKRKFILVMISIVSMLLLIVGCDKTTPTSSNVANEITNSNKKVVIATTYAVYDWAKQIIKDTDTIELKYLVDTNVDLHSYQPSAEDIVTYKSADLVFCIGGESEEWLEEIGLDENKVCSLIDVVEKKEEELIEGMQGEEEHEHEEGSEEEHEEEPEYDEHIWLSVKNAEKCVAEIANKLSELDNEHSTVFKNNCDSYVAKIDTLDKEYNKVVDKASCKTLLFGDRFPFRYLVDDYGLNYYAAFIGCSAESEASFETIAFLAKKTDELGLKTICVISSNHDIANSIISTTQEKNQSIVEFNSLQSVSNKEADNISYIDIMTNNLSALKTALGE